MTDKSSKNIDSLEIDLNYTLFENENETSGATRVVLEKKLEVRVIQLVLLLHSQMKIACIFRKKSLEGKNSLEW